MTNNSLAIVIYGETNSNRNALTEEKYRGLANAFIEKGFRTKSVLYNDQQAEKLLDELRSFDAILVWVNPIEQGNGRKKLDALLLKLSDWGCYVSTHPEVILKIGTKDVLYKTRVMDWGGDIKMYASYDDLKRQFFNPDDSKIIKILKQYRGNGGNGVFKIDSTDYPSNKIKITPAWGEMIECILSIDDFFQEMKTYFLNDNMLIEQPWNRNIINGMVRCYLTGNKVSGFGYQEINAFYPRTENVSKPPGKRFYFTEQCGLFQDLRQVMETEWVPQLQEITDVKTDMLPVIWDVDFFINTVNSIKATEKYTLCEINVSCVSPFPESAIPFIVKAVGDKIKK